MRPLRKTMIRAMELRGFSARTNATFERYPCPKCKAGMLRVIGELPRWRFGGG